ncbi:transposase [Catenuloplanes indicus]|uniref:Transposase n=1 Tax=Catenuloplanes indicus TaxID=137267 RepID=A0AAE3VXM9_9ACTN|nr:transposase [Catenuloplanes indicus]MDQ0365182.1 hypothetical protein [Catenuloplanes indicus]
MSRCLVPRSIPSSSVRTPSIWSAPWGRTIRDVGRELGVNHETPRNWVAAAKRAEQGPTAGDSGAGGQVSPAEREELNRLRKKVAELELSLFQPDIAGQSVSVGVGDR